MSRGALIFASTVSMALSAGAWAGTEGSSSTFYGQGAGAAGNPDSGENTYMGTDAGNAAVSTGNTFMGSLAGASVTTGPENTLFGLGAGKFTTTGGLNTIVGAWAGGGLPLGHMNVLVGYGAGYSETGSNKLYIDNCWLTGSPECNRPLIYGEFDNRLLRVDGVLQVAANSVSKSQLNFSLDHTDTGGYLTSVLDNNFFTSSGARWDGADGGWVQRSPDGKAVIAGSGGVGYRVLTSSGGAVGSVVVPVTRLHIDYDGLMGVNTSPVAGRAINTSTGAYLSSGGVWTNASSRALKADIADLPAERALEAFRELRPVTFRYNDEAAGHVGFIAEDVPALVATPGRKGLSPMDVVAVLTKVVQEQDARIARLERQLADALVGGGNGSHR